MGPVVDAKKANQAEPILAPISYPLAMCARPHMPNEFHCALAKRTKSSKSTDLRQADRLTLQIFIALELLHCQIQSYPDCL